MNKLPNEAPSIRKPYIIETASKTGWSLTVHFGLGNQGREAMRRESDFFRNRLKGNDTASDVTQADRQLWKFIIDASKLQCACIDTEEPTSLELQAIARHRIAATCKHGNPSELAEKLQNLLAKDDDLLIGQMMRLYGDIFVDALNTRKHDPHIDDKPGWEWNDELKTYVRIAATCEPMKALTTDVRAEDFLNGTNQC